MNKLYFGDNLDVLRKMPAESVDLIYLDPPFNSNANYNVLYGTKRGGPSQAQAHAFEDTWKWGRDAKSALDQTAERHLEAGALLDAFQKVFGGTNMMAYLAMMAVRLIEMQRVLKETGSLYLHCDPTASHYLKLLLDAIFGIRLFENEIKWKRTHAHGDSRLRFASVTDALLFYSKSGKHTFHLPRVPYPQSYIDKYYRYADHDGRRYQLVSLRSPNPRPNLTYSYKGVEPHRNGWAVSLDKMKQLDEQGRLRLPEKPGQTIREKYYLDEMPGVPITDLWDDIPPINSQAQERLGYSTQKPLALLERIITTSSNEGDIVLDPFCGCGTAIEAAEKLNRKWIGIDITYLAIHVIEARLVRTFGPDIKKKYELFGKPRDAHDANVLAARDWLEFQKWAVFQLGGLPKDRAGPDGGIDGIIRYHRVGVEQPNRAVVSVKGGLHVGVDAVHKLKSVMDREKAELGVLVCVNAPTSAMKKEAASAGDIGPSSKRVAKIQIVTIDMLFERNPVDCPGVLDLPEVRPAPIPPQPKKGRKRIEGQAELLFPIAGEMKEKPQQEIKKRPPARSIRVIDIEVTRPYRRRGPK